MCETYVTLSIESISQSENDLRSDSINWGIKQKAAQGTSKLNNRKCHGYKNGMDGELIINEEETKNVQLIFNPFLDGNSLLGMLKKPKN